MHLSQLLVLAASLGSLGLWTHHSRLCFRLPWPLPVSVFRFTLLTRTQSYWIRAHPNNLILKNN